MKYFILSLFVVFAGAWQYYEPDDLYCTCAGSNDPLLGSYDGRAKMIVKAQKTLLSRWNDNPDDICKFQLRVVTKDDIDGNPTDLHYDWIGFAYGVHTVNHDKFRHNFVFANDVNGNGKVAIRGQGFQSPQILDLTSPYTDTIDNCHWTVTKINDNKFTMRSDCCPYALDWLPNGLGTKWQIWVSDGTKYKDETMQGMCGDCNDDPMNDWVKCDDPGNVLDMSDDSIEAISDSCVEGPHQGTEPLGGRRLG